MTARRWQQIEGALIFAAALAMLWGGGLAGLSWWVAVLLFFAPDLSFAAYLFGPRVGAVGYNAVHIYAFGGVLVASGIVGTGPLVAVLGWLWLGHAGFDRMLGYGLKLPSGFKHTHLGDL